MNKIITTISLTLSLNCYAIIDSCGEYEVSGIVRNKNNVLTIVANEGTLSEKEFELKDQQFTKLIPYINDHVKTNIIVNDINNVKKLKNTTLINIEERYPNPLNPEDTYTRLVNKKICE